MRVLLFRRISNTKAWCGICLGRVVVADTIDHAVALARKYRYSLRIVTLEGELLSPGGSMTGGAFKNSSNLLGRRREIEELEESVKLLKKDHGCPSNQAIDENRSKRNALRDKIAALAEKLQKEYLVPEYGKNGDQPDGIPPGRDGFRLSSPEG